MDLCRHAFKTKKKDRGGNMYENERSNVAQAPAPTERGNGAV